MHGAYMALAWTRVKACVQTGVATYVYSPNSYVVMAYIVMAYIVMAFVVLASAVTSVVVVGIDIGGHVLVVLASRLEFLLADLRPILILPSHACVGACVRACVRACVLACLRALEHATSLSEARSTAKPGFLQT